MNTPLPTSSVDDQYSQRGAHLHLSTQWSYCLKQPSKDSNVYIMDAGLTSICITVMRLSMLRPVQAIVGQGGDLTNLNINCPNMRDIPYNQIPLQKMGDYWGFDTRSVTVQYTETIAVFKMSSEVIKCPAIGASSFGQSPYIARHLPVQGVVGHNIDRRITAHRNWLSTYSRKQRTARAGGKR